MADQSSAVNLSIDDCFDHRRLGQGRDIAEITGVTLSDLAQNPTHHLARAGLRQTGDDTEAVDSSVGADSLAA